MMRSIDLILSHLPVETRIAIDVWRRIVAEDIDQRRRLLHLDVEAGDHE